MTVSYRMSMGDTLQWFRYRYGRTILDRVFLALLFALPLAASMIIAFTFGPLFAGSVYQNSALHHNPPNPKVIHTMLVVFWLALGYMYIILPVFGLAGLYLGSLIMRKITVTFDSQFCYAKSFMNVKVPWKLFSKAAEEPDYFYFLGRTRMVQIPKRAFDSRADGEAFFNTASAYWHKAKGIPPPPVPDTTSVWPPAPTLEQVEQPK